MLWFCFLALLSCAFPLLCAWYANRRTTLSLALVWAGCAWFVWVIAFLLAALAEPETSRTLRYVALTITLCPPIMVLGARRPGVLAWNFVVVGLLVTLLLPVAQGWGKPRLETPWLLFVAVCLAVCVLNYLPTRLGLAALLIGGACGWELYALGQFGEALPALPGLLLAVALWLGYLSMRTRSLPKRPVDRLWIDFRDRFGVVWGQRVREQFNRAVDNASLPVVLHWHGLENTGVTPDENQVEETLKAVLKRFGLVD